jgi:tellurite resistance protein
VTGAADLTAAMAAVTSAMASGTLTPDEAQAVAAVLEGQRRALETSDLERRIAALENK